ncbi:MAG: hypothetical protein ACKO1L_13505, partial [Brachymonas sp.]
AKKKAQNMRKIIENQPNRRICSYQRVNTTEKHDLLRPSLDVFNLFNRKNDDIQYFYESQLLSEVTAIADTHLHPGEPRSARVSLKVNF